MGMAINIRRVPLVDLAAQHAEIADEVAAGLATVIESGCFVGGPEVTAFECELARAHGVGHCVGVANGTDALEFALRAADIGRGDEVILPANTFIATAEAVVRAGATPVLVDSDAEFHLIDVDAAAAAIGSRTAALIAVHLYGQLAPMERLCDLTQKASLALVEDAAQAQVARRSRSGAGSFGLAAATSFYPGKNLGAYGDGGAALTDDPAIARRVRLLGNHGSEVKYDHVELGFNSRLDAMQAVVLRAKLSRLAGWNAQRRAAARRYHELLADIDDVHTPGVLPGNEHVWHLYVVRVPAARRDALVQALAEGGIGVGVHYPVPIHLQGAFRHLGYCQGDFPVAEAAAAQIVSLPLYPHITPGQQERVVDAIARVLR
ncbi:MAG TPA: DegT/DnrJ/EryC1/StrS family aminotransferase [Acidimicrobiales bacterium]|nr:DegT/DnrJ/EryC1/StrS family aminotransferase [Acidimicrobiales bacterium]